MAAGPINDWCVLGFDVRVPRANKRQAISADPAVFLRPLKVEDFLGSSWQEPWNPLGLVSDFKKLVDMVSHHEISEKEYLCITCHKAIPFALNQRFGPGWFENNLNAQNLDMNSWKFCGYDILDLRGLISGIAGCKVGQEKEFSWATLNDHQLFDDLSCAHYFSEARGVEIPTHAPFVPVGIYIAKS